MPYIDARVASTRVLPALVTLGSDQNLNVKYASIEAFGAVAQHFKNDMVLVLVLHAVVIAVFSSNFFSDFSSYYDYLRLLIRYGYKWMRSLMMDHLKLQLLWFVP